MRGEHVLGTHSGRRPGPGDDERIGREPGTPYKGGDAWVASGKLVSNTTSSANAMRYAGGFEDNPTGTSGTSIFDPTLCELTYRWYTSTGGQVIDPFAGGSVRGIVARMLGRRYWGCDL